MNNNSLYTLSLIVCASLLFLSSCIHKRHIDKKELHYTDPLATHIAMQHSPHYQAPPITIWIHGTLLFHKPNYYHIFHDTSYLISASELPTDHFFHRLARVISSHDPQTFPLETFYIFGWSGKLLSIERKVAARQLYNSMKNIIEQYQAQYNRYPLIRIIAHSHGGNVVLNMAKIKNVAALPEIDSLVLLACPVQEKTMNLINNPMFKHVYSLYSSFDIVQVLAPQIFRPQTIDIITHKRKRHYRFPPFSSRLFPQYPHLIQAKVKINGYPISHTRFSMIHFVKMLPTIVSLLDQWHIESIEKDTMSKHKLLCIYT